MLEHDAATQCRWLPFGNLDTLADDSETAGLQAQFFHFAAVVNIANRDDHSIARPARVDRGRSIGDPAFGQSGTQPAFDTFALVEGLIDDNSAYKLVFTQWDSRKVVSGRGE